MSRPFVVVLAVLVLIAIPVVIAWRIIVFVQSPMVDRELSDKWIIEIGRNGGRYLSRRTDEGWLKVSGKIFDAVTLGDDCAMYSDYQLTSSASMVSRRRSPRLSGARSRSPDASGSTRY